MNKKELSMIIGLLLTVIFAQITAFAYQCEPIRENSLRLHILANSDSDYDQEVKLMVRDSILEETDELFLSFSGFSETVHSSNEIISLATEVANRKLDELNYPYDASAEIVNMYFTTRRYSDFTMPAGEYEALQISIGEASGENWWCVMYPPMCIPSAMKESEDAKNIEELNNSASFLPAFAIIELFEDAKHLLSSRE